jgi:plastocyanin
MRAGALALAVAVLAGMTGEAVRKPATVRVTIEAMKFSPAGATARPGDTIVWTNSDLVAHTVTSEAGLFDSKLIPPGGTWKYIVKKTGAFEYKCSYHLPMSGAFTVR